MTDSELKTMILEDILTNNFTTLTDSSSSSPSDIEQEPTARQKKTKIEHFVEHVIKNYNEQEFQTHFRLTKPVAYALIDKLDKANVLPIHPDGRPKISGEKAFLLTLWYLGNTETFRQIGDRFNCTPSSAYRSLKRVVSWLTKIRGEYIQWPNAERAHTISESFASIRGITNVIGLIDGSHIEIPKPKQNQDAYCNRKGYHSLLFQGIVDCDKKFIDVFCGEPGSMNDARLFRKSGIYKFMAENPNFMRNNFLLGDSAYPNLHWVVTPFTDNGNLSREQQQFNYFHAATRIPVEHAFGLLKSRFRRLRKLDNIHLNFCSQLIMASCVLHNICINNNDIVEYQQQDYNQPEPLILQEYLPVLNRQIAVFQDLFRNN